MGIKEISSMEKRIAENWQKRLPPARPSKDIVDFYEQAAVDEAGGRSGMTWGLLGCTPEIRSLAGKYQADILCVDKNPVAFSAFRSLCEPSKKEKFMCSDWLEADLPEKFDIIFGDGSISMLPLEKHEAFLASVHRMLRRDGLALLRVNLAEPNAEGPGEVFAWYRKNHSDRQIYYAVKPYLGVFCLDAGTMKVNSEKMEKLVRELYESGAINSEEAEAFESAEKTPVEVQYTRKDLLESSMSLYFKIEDIYYAGDIFNNLHRPVYRLRKKYTRNPQDNV